MMKPIAITPIAYAVITFALVWGVATFVRFVGRVVHHLRSHHT